MAKVNYISLSIVVLLFSIHWRVGNFTSNLSNNQMIAQQVHDDIAIGHWPYVGDTHIIKCKLSSEFKFMLYAPNKMYKYYALKLNND